MDIDKFQKDLQEELSQMAEVKQPLFNQKDLENLRMSLMQLYTEMLIYVCNSKWQTIENIQNIALYSQNLSTLYNKLGYSSTQKVDLDQIYNISIQQLSTRFYTLDFPKSRPEDWDIPNLTSRDFIRDFVRHNAKTVETKGFLNSSNTTEEY